MTNGTTAPVDQAPELAAAAGAEGIYQAALERRLARQDAALAASRTSQLRAQTEGGPDTPGTERDGAADRPGTLDEWIDREVTGGPHASHDPVLQTAYAILEAARKGPAEAVAAVPAAAALTEAQQWGVFRALTALANAGYEPGAAMMRAVLAEWQVRGLADRCPAPPAAAR